MAQREREEEEAGETGNTGGNDEEGEGHTAWRHYSSYVRESNTPEGHPRPQNIHVSTLRARKHTKTPATREPYKTIPRHHIAQR